MNQNKTTIHSQAIFTSWEITVFIKLDKNKQEKKSETNGYLEKYQNKNSKMSLIFKQKKSSTT